MIDGVIKFRVEHRDGALPFFGGYRELEALRSRLFALGLIGEKKGIGYGNLSMRSEKPGSFFITATQTGNLPSLHADRYSYIEKYDFTEFKVRSRGPFKPSSEALSHAMIYEADPEINTVIHIHSAPLWAFMIREKRISTAAAYGTSEMAEEIASLFRDRESFTERAFVMKGHEEGIMTFGRSVSEAERTLYRIIADFLGERTL